MSPCPEKTCLILVTFECYPTELPSAKRVDQEIAQQDIPSGAVTKSKTNKSTQTCSSQEWGYQGTLRRNKASLVEAGGRRLKGVCPLPCCAFYVAQSSLFILVLISWPSRADRSELQGLARGLPFWAGEHQRKGRYRPYTIWSLSWHVLAFTQPSKAILLPRKERIGNGLRLLSQVWILLRHFFDGNPGRPLDFTRGILWVTLVVI